MHPPKGNFWKRARHPLEDASSNEELWQSTGRGRGRRIVPWAATGSRRTTGKVAILVQRTDDASPVGSRGCLGEGIGIEAAGVARGARDEGFPMQLPCACRGCIPHGGDPAGDADGCQKGRDACPLPERPLPAAAGFHGFVAVPDERGPVRARIGVAWIPRAPDDLGHSASGGRVEGVRAAGDRWRRDAVPVAHRGASRPSDGWVDRVGDLQPALRCEAGHPGDADAGVAVDGSQGVEGIAGVGGGIPRRRAGVAGGVSGRLPRQVGCGDGDASVDRGRGE